MHFVWMESSLSLFENNLFQLKNLKWKVVTAHTAHLFTVGNVLLITINENFKVNLHLLRKFTCKLWMDVKLDNELYAMDRLFYFVASNFFLKDHDLYELNIVLLPLCSIENIIVRKLELDFPRKKNNRPIVQKETNIFTRVYSKLTLNTIVETKVLCF